MRGSKRESTPPTCTHYFAESPNHAAMITGTLKIPIISPNDLVITKGEFNLFVDDPDHIDEKLMKYRIAY